MKGQLSVNQEHEYQIQQFLKFARLKKVQHTTELLSEIDDFSDIKIPDGEVLNSEEVADLISQLKSSIKPQIQNEIENSYYTSAILFYQLLEQAQNNGLQLEVDTNMLENEALFQQMQETDKRSLSSPIQKVTSRRINSLQSLHSTKISDPEVLKQRDQLKEQVSQQQTTINDLTASLATANQQQKSYASKIQTLESKIEESQSALQAQVGATSSKEQELQNSQKQQQKYLDSQMEQLSLTKSAEGTLEQVQKELVQSQKQVAKLTGELDELKAELKTKQDEARKAEELLSKKLNETKQYQQMKKIMLQKSQELMKIRKRLQVYEPQTDLSPTIDDDGP